MNSLWNTGRVTVLVFALIVSAIITGCGGGSSPVMPDPTPTPTPNVAYYQGFAPVDGEVLDVAGYYTRLSADGKKVPTVIVAGQVVRIPKGSYINVSGKIFARKMKLTRDGEWQSHIEITNVKVDNTPTGSPLINNREGKFVALLDGQNLAAAGSTDFTWTIRCADLPQDGTLVPITIKAEIQDSWLGYYGMSLFGMKPEPGPPVAKVRGKDHGWEFPAAIVALGTIASFFAPVCPTAELTFYVGCEMPDTPPVVTPPAQVQIRPRNLVGNDALDKGDAVRFEAVNCPAGHANWSVNGGAQMSDPGTSNTGWATILLTATQAGSWTISVVCGEHGSDSTVFEVKQPQVIPPVNQAPIIDNFDCATATELLCVDFTVDAHDVDGTIVDYFYEFGDSGSLSTLHTTDATVSHCYATSGTYTAKVTVTDDDGATDTATCVVTVADGGGDDDPFVGITAQIRPNALDNRTLDKSEGDEHQFNLMLLTSGGQEFTPPAGTTYQVWWDGNNGAQQMELEITEGGKLVRVYAALSTVGTHTFRIRATNGTHFREDERDIIINP